METNDLTVNQVANADERTSALLSRVRHTLRRAFDYGSALFIVGVLFATLTALSLRVAVPAYQEYLQAYNLAVRTLFHTTLVSRPTQSEKAILAVIPASIAAAEEQAAKQAGVTGKMPGPLECKSDCPDAALLAGVRKVFAEADRLTRQVWSACEEAPDSQKAVEPGNAKSKQEATPDCISRALREEMPTTEHTLNVKTRLLPDIATVVSARLSPGNTDVKLSDFVTACAAFRSDASRERIAYLPSPECDTEESFSETALVVPQQIVPASDGVAWNPRARLSVLESRLFEDVVQQLDLKGEAPSNSAATGNSAGMWPRPILVAAYFISLDGILRYWSRSGKPALARAYSSRIWTQTAYFYPLLVSSDESSPTDVYLDIAGNGLVRTYCYPIDGQRLGDYSFDAAKKNVSTAPESSFVGALCTDLSFPDTLGVMARVIGALRNNPLIDAALYNVSLDSSGQVESIGRSLSSGDQSVLPTGWPESQLVSALKSRACNSTSPNAVRARESPWSDIQSCDLTNDVQVLLIPLYKQAGSQLVALAIRPHAPELKRKLKFSVAAALFGMVGMIVCGFGLGGSRTRSELAKELGRVRSLPVAMVDCDVNDTVIAGNDRLEEIVQKKVSKFGLPPVQSETTFNELFENFVQGFLTPDGKSPVSDITRTDVELRAVTLDEDLRRARVAGHRSVYFASVKASLVSPLETQKPARAKRQWVRVIASPVMSAEESGVFRATAEGRSTKWVPTFGVLIEVTEAEATKLNAWLDEKK